MHLSERDREYIWHPFTQEKTANPVIAIQRAEGSYLYDAEGKAYLDLISSWWVTLHGHAHPLIAERIYEQAKRVEHVMFAGFTHEPAVALCEALHALLPPDLRRFFFSDNGSTAVEVALRMAYQYWRNQGISERTSFLSFEGGYHGDTVGAMSVGAHSGFYEPFLELLFKVRAIPFPATWEGDETVEAKEKRALDALEQLLEAEGHRMAACIVEPLVQGASGMRMCRPTFLQSVVARVREKGILVIFDEVMTGFGRTGKMFAFSHITETPDFLCLSKGLSGGFLPLALTVTKETIYEAFLSEHWKKAFAHGHSYTANPLACAAANASLALLHTPRCQEAIQSIQRAHQKGIRFLKEKKAPIQHARITGTICAFEVTTPIVKEEWMAQCLKRGLLLRPLGNTVYLLPPYSTTLEELEEAYCTLYTLLRTISSERYTDATQACKERG